jgi:hypothetical protein
MGLNEDLNIVLVFGQVLDRRAFDIYNWYKRIGEKITFLFEENSLRRTCLYPGSWGYSGEWEDLCALAMANTNKQFVVLPLLEEQVLKIYQNIDNKPNNIYFLTPSLDTFNLLIDKVKLTDWAKDFGCSPGRFSLEELREANFWYSGCTIMAKPVRGRGSKGLTVLKSFEDVMGFNAVEPYVFQEFVGDGKTVVGYFALADKGIVVSSYQHVRRRTYPESGGVSTFAELCCNPEIEHLGTAMVKELNYSGLLMFEFIADDTGQWKLLECNPRLWGTVMLGEFSGFSLLKNYIRICVGETADNSAVVNPKGQIRWMFPYEYIWVIKKVWLRFGELLPNRNCWKIGQSGAGFRFVWYVIFSLFDISKWETFMRKLRQS